MNETVALRYDTLFSSLTPTPPRKIESRMGWAESRAPCPVGETRGPPTSLSPGGTECRCGGRPCFRSCFDFLGFTRCYPLKSRDEGNTATPFTSFPEPFKWGL